MRDKLTYAEISEYYNKVRDGAVENTDEGNSDV